MMPATTMRAPLRALKSMNPSWHMVTPKMTNRIKEQIINPYLANSIAQPFLKWAGGKTQLLNTLFDFFPKDFNGYFEPFLGSAAVFFFLRRQYGQFTAHLNDANEELINSYRIIRDDLDSLLPELEQLKRNHSTKQYYAIRAKSPETLGTIQRAARLIYLNKTCFNGLYRVNSKGEFNVPIGSYKNPKIYEKSGLRAASNALEEAKLHSGDFNFVLEYANAKDLVYFDPPYYTEGNGFTSYANTGFGKSSTAIQEHRRLAEVAQQLTTRGVYVVISNSDSEYTRKLYSTYHEFTVHEIRARRNINSKGSGRGPVSELVVTNYEKI